MNFFYIILMILFIILIVYFWIQNHVLKVSRYKIKDKKIPPAFNRYKIIQISDFHNSFSKKKHNDIIKIIKEENPDIIVITGDLIGNTITNYKISLNFVKKISTLCHVYYVNGNHEAFDINYKNLENGLRKIGVKVLRNEFVVLNKNNSKINIIGVDDPYFENIKCKNTKLKEIKINNNYYKILLSHRPELFKEYCDNKIDLVFTGHAHGGQVILPIIGSLFAPNQGLFPKYTKGLIKNENTKMIVSRGLCNSSFPYRFNNKVELVIATLNNEKE